MRESSPKSENGQKRAREEDPVNEVIVSNPKITNIESLKKPLLGMVLSHLDPEDLASAPYVSTRFYRAQNAAGFWENYAKRHPLLGMDANHPKKTWLLGKYIQTNNLENMDYELLWSLLIKRMGEQLDDFDVFFRRNQELLDPLYNYIKTQYSINSDDATVKSRTLTILYWAMALNQPEQAAELIKAKAGIMVDDFGTHNLGDESVTELVAYLFAWLVAADHDRVLRILCDASLFQKHEERYQHSAELAIRENSPKALKLLLKHGVESNQIIDEEGNTPLMEAAYFGYIECGIALLDNLASVNQQNNIGRTALMIAVLEGRVEFAKLLLKKGANCNLRGKKFKRNALQMAINIKNSDLAKQLIDHTDDLDAQDAEGDTALHLATLVDLPDIVSLLLKMNANKNIPNRLGIMPLLYALAKGSMPCINALQPEANITSDALQGDTLLIRGAAKGDETFIKSLIERGEDVNKPNSIGSTPLHIASYTGNIKAAEVFLKHNADINASDVDGFTPLRHAVEQNKIEIVKLLIQEKADVNLANKRGTTPLWIAACQGNMPILKLLMDAGAEVATTIQARLDYLLEMAEGNSPLIDKIQELSTQKGTDCPEMSAIEIAELMGHKEAAELLANHLPEMEPPFKRMGY
jgi:ankyrin repeat protein